MNPKITLLLLLCCFTCALTNAQGKLNKAKEELSSGSSSSSSSSSDSSNSSNSWDDDENNHFEQILNDIIDQIVFGILFGDMEQKYFYDYPYANGSHGEYALPEENASLKSMKLMLSNTFFASGKEFYGNDVKLNFRFMRLLGVEVNHLHFFEKIPKSELGINSLMLNYYRVREKMVTAFWGVGVSHVIHGVDKIGFTYQVGIDVYLKKPFSLSTLWKQSFINNSSVNEFKLHARYHLNRFSVHGGFNRYKLGSVEINSMGIGFDYRF
ncbi:hypothetical protein [uncultured Kordia sp.]|uniref:hypothetical protein n=1 Tax=uncultured Kordia sp. TaxID=507699 RepID=UPI002623249C|nr:hypothetical protein [uncultured Kordia sp.]